MKKALSEGTLAANNVEIEKALSQKYIIIEELVAEYLVYLETLKVQKVKRKSKQEDSKAKKDAKSYNNCNWSYMYRQGTFKKHLLLNIY